ncbi:MAG: sugar phosphate isomerase/epimerase [Spirochaetales bacterium]|nr:sugar phosphate isomerase/epimerase [Spirochaetales bacterium]
MKYSVISSFLSRTKDRFHEYNTLLSLEEKFAMASKIKGISAMECVYPYEVNSPEDTLALMKKYKIDISAVNVNIKAEPEFRMGGITSPDKKVRDRAISFIKEGKDFAEAIGVKQITVCPLGDGYEFAFQSDYEKCWQYLKEAFGAAASYKPEITTFIEFKPSETRGTCFLPDAAKTVLLIEQIGKPGLGVTLDVGHVLYGGKNPAEELALLQSCYIPYYIHMNDNDGKWDWDYFTGSKHILEYLEFVYYLKKFNYQGYIVSDTSPTRTGIISTFEANNRVTDKFCEICERLDIEKYRYTGDYMDLWKHIESELFK